MKKIHFSTSPNFVQVFPFSVQLFFVIKMSAAESNGFSFISDSYYENFLESLAQIVSKLLTDQETEAVLTSIRSFQEKLRRLSR